MAEGYKIYYVCGAILQPGSPITTTTNTNITIAITNNGVQRFWVEAFSGTNSSVTRRVAISTSSGWSIQSSAGVSSTPCIRCVNIPLDSSLTISFATTLSAITMWTYVTNSIKSSGFSGQIDIIQSIKITADGIIRTNAFNMSSPNFSDFTVVNCFGTITSTGAYALTGAGICTITISNKGDADGINSILLDNVNFGAGSGDLSANPFTTATVLSGNIE